MTVKILSTSYLGIEPFLVETQIDISRGLPMFTIVGLGDTAISESKDRIRAAIKNSGYFLEPRRITVNLSPANIRKVGSQFDLPIAVGILLAMEEVTDLLNKIEKYIFIGELALDGELKWVEGTVSSVILAKEFGFKGVVVPYANYSEANLIDGIEIIPCRTLMEVVNFLRGYYVKKDKPELQPNEEMDYGDFAEVKGQELAKRALEIVAAGGHNLIMIGTPGSGKSMLAKRLRSILPPMTSQEIIESTKIYSIAGELDKSRPIIDKRPFRAPHHTTTVSAMVGGGTIPKPGEITLANNGVLFLDEIGEFSRGILETLRQPLEDRKISITRSNYKVDFPAKFILVAASNPCPCGYAYEDGDRCTCTQYEINRYTKKLSGPILDRIDIQLKIRRLRDEELIEKREVENSETIKQRVVKAREFQKERFGEEKLNSQMDEKEIERFCKLNQETKKILKIAITSLNISARGYNKILKIARTISDLKGKKEIEKEEILEALSFRISE
jgi:magnesium chelatase family protein